MSARALLAGFAKSVLVHRHAFVPSPAQTLAIGRVDRRVELDQHLARLDGVAIMHMDRADDADLEGLDDFGPPARDDLARCSGDDVDGTDAGPGQRHRLPK